MTATNLGKTALLSIVGALATTVCALAVMTAEPGTPPDDPPTQASTVRSEPTTTRLPVSGTLVLPGSKPAGRVRVFYSTRDYVGDVGQIRAEASADAEGRFSLTIPPAEGAEPGYIGTGTLWAYRPGSSVATIPVYRGALPRGLPLRLTVGPTAGALFEVHDPDGKPVAGARIEPKTLDRHYTSAPGSLTSQTPWTKSASGEFPVIRLRPVP